MACGSVYAKEPRQVGRDLAHLDLSVGDFRSPPGIKNKTVELESPPGNSRFVQGFNSRGRCCGGQEAIRFLQAEHEKILDGLHAEMLAVQQKCGDLQFEAHLRHVVDSDERTWKAQIEQLKTALSDKDSTIEKLQAQLAEYERENDDFRERSKWKEVQLKQQIELGEQRLVNLREECLSLRGKVRDLKMYSAALRRGDSASRPGSRTSVTDLYPDEQPLSLESGELSLSGTWRDTRLSISQPKRSRQPSGSSVEKLPLDRSLSSSFDLSAMSSPSTARSSLSRPGSVILPPINLSQSVGRPQFRQHMRFSSAPPVNPDSQGGRRRASEASLQKKKPAD
ncbi:hypothetical protein FHG87_009024 [Trinorchestia longiramus]|nr:hypothetical protein FHG87_009024 [Trinorchestia longiramus]